MKKKRNPREMVVVQKKKMGYYVRVVVQKGKMGYYMRVRWKRKEAERVGMVVEAGKGVGSLCIVMY
jgi:hypothetical protein